MALASGTRLGRYEIVTPLGAGGMGEVYKARDARLDRTVAIKVLPQHVASDRQARERFEREARTISQLTHPHICALYDVGHHDDTTYLVLEYLDGQTLAERLRDGPLPMPEALAIAAEVADALDQAHRQHIVHRDLKPSNIMLTKAGTKLLDFGLAKAMPGRVLHEPAAFTRSGHLTGQGTIVGTLPYMAPEQVEGRDADARTDIFAFGAILYELLSGRRAFDGQGATLIAAILERHPAPLVGLEPNVPELLDRVIRRCLEKDPDKRWQSVRDVAIALQWSNDVTPPAAPPEPNRRRRHAVSVALMVAAVLLAGAAGAWIASRGPEALPAAAVRFVLTDPPVAANFAGGLPSFAMARDGSVFIYAVVENGVRRLYQRRIGDTEAAPIAGTDGATAPFLSPDAQWVAFTVTGTTASRLRKVSLRGGDPVTVCELGATRGAAWGDDGTIVFAPNPEFGLWRVSADGGAPVPITRPDANKGERSHRWPSLLPDRRSVLYTIAGSDLTTFDDAVIAMRDLDSGVVTELVRGGSYPVYLPATGHLLYSRAGTLLAVPLDLERRTTRGAAVTVLTDIVTYPVTGAAEFATSDGGILLSLSGGAATSSDIGVIVVDRQGYATRLPFPVAAFGSPRLAPDGRTIAFGVDGANSSIWVGDIEKATAVRLTSRWTSIWPVWAPDGQRVAYASGRGDGHRLFVQSIDGRGQPEQITAGEHRHSAPTSWSSDGRYIMYDDQVPPATRDVMLVDLAEQQRTFPLVQTPFDEHSAKFSPDMKAVTYVSNESGNAEVYVQTFPARLRKTRVSPAGGVQPVWARSGRELYYVSGDAMMVIDVETQPQLTVGSPRVLFRRPMPTNYDVTADGRFLMYEERRSPLHAAPLTVTVNWLDMLRRPN